MSETKPLQEEATEEHTLQEKSKEESAILEKPDFEKVEIQQPPLFDSQTLTATYIIIQPTKKELDKEQENRNKERILEEIKHYAPCSDIYTVSQKPQETVTEVHFRIFEHAAEHKKANILVLEDDLFFSNRIKQSEIVDSISSFIQDKNKQEEPFLYSLGCLPIFAMPEPNTTQTCCSKAARSCKESSCWFNLFFGVPPQMEKEEEHYWGLTTEAHACIYSEELRKEWLQGKRELVSWKMPWLQADRTYFFYEPLVFPHHNKCPGSVVQDTENKQCCLSSPCLKEGLSSPSPFKEWICPKSLFQTSTYGYFYMYDFAKYAWVLVLLLLAAVVFAIRYLAQFIQSLVPKINISITPVTIQESVHKTVTEPDAVHNKRCLMQQPTCCPTTQQNMKMKKSKPSFLEYVSVKIPVDLKHVHKKHSVMQQPSDLGHSPFEDYDSLFRL